MNTSAYFIIYKATQIMKQDGLQIYFEQYFLMEYSYALAQGIHDNFEL